MPAYQEYPMWLRHPRAQPAVISDAWAHGAPPVGYVPPPGKPATFPPVQVNNPDQEAYYLAKGYQRGAVSAKAADDVAVAPVPAGYEHQEWPRIVDGVLQQDPGLPRETPGEYPKYVRLMGAEKLVRNREEEGVFRAEHKPEPPEAEREFFAALAAAEAALTQSDDELETLRRRAEILKIDVDGRWRAPRLRQEIAAAEQK